MYNITGTYDKPKDAIEMAFDKLGLDYINMMLLHHPGKNDVIPYVQSKGYAYFYIHLL